MRALVLAVLSSSLLAANVPSPEEATVEMTTFQGRWEVVRCIDDKGDYTPVFAKSVYAFEGEDAVLYDGGPLAKRGTIHVGPDEGRHGRVDIHWKSPEETDVGIYRLVGDQIEIAFTNNARPTGFKLDKESNITLMWFRRAKK
jgi:uncharacterized protein (TIGR03067 family)